MAGTSNPSTRYLVWLRLRLNNLRIYAKFWKVVSEFTLKYWRGGIEGVLEEGGDAMAVAGAAAEAFGDAGREEAGLIGDGKIFFMPSSVYAKPLEEFKEEFSPE